MYRCSTAYAVSEARKNHFRRAARTDPNQQGSVGCYDADRQGGGNAGEEASVPVKDAEALFRKLRRFVKTDYNSKGQVNWRREAREDFYFEAGEQLNEEDKTILQDAKRPIVIFNALERWSIA